MKKLIFLLFLLSLATSQAVAAETPRVVVSIKPLHSLVSGVMAGVAEPELIVKKGSPHGYSLRPSEARALAKADLVVWVGHELESFLEKPLQTLAGQARQLELADLLKKDLLVKRQGGTWEAPAHHHGDEENNELHEEHEAAHHHGDEDDHKSHGENKAADLHLWLDPGLAKKIVTATAATLSALDPAHAQQYSVNEQKLLTRLAQLDAGLKKQLEPVKDRPYLVFHAAYQYFEAAYGLNAVGSVTIDPERKPGAKRIREIRQKLQAMNARCVFSEPQFESRLVNTIIEGTGVKTATLDPLGSPIPPGPDAYFSLMQQLADNLKEGLE